MLLAGEEQILHSLHGVHLSTVEACGESNTPTPTDQTQVTELIPSFDAGEGL